MIEDGAGSPRHSEEDGGVEGTGRAMRAEGGARRRALVVLGAHRSGTSAITRVLNLLGASLPHHIMPANSANSPGYWEPIRLVQINDDLLANLGSYWDDWRAHDPRQAESPAVEGYLDRIEDLLLEEYGDAPLLVLKDPRLCRLVPFYETVFGRLGIEPLYVLINRDPLDVAASLMRRESFTVGFACLLWLRHELEAEATTRERRRVFLSFESLRGDWRSVLETVAAQLGTSWPLDPDEVADQVDSALSHVPQGNNPEIASLDTHPVIAGWVDEAHRALTSLETSGDTARNGGSAESLATLDRLRTELDEIAHSVGPMIYEELDWRKRRRLRDKGRLPERMVRLEPIVAALEQNLAARDAHIRALQKNLETHDDYIRNLEAELVLARRRLDRMSDALRMVLHSNSWRLTAPLRALMNLIRPGSSHSADPLFDTSGDETVDAPSSAQGESPGSREPA